MSRGVTESDSLFRMNPLGTNAEEGWEGESKDRDIPLDTKNHTNRRHSFEQVCEPYISIHVMSPTDVSEIPGCAPTDKQFHTDICSDT